MNHLSASSLDTFRRCPLQWRFRYVEGIKVPPSVAIVQGASVHRGAEYNYSYKVETGEDLPTDEILDVTRDAFSLESEAVEDWADTKPGKALDESVGMASVYHTELAPTVAPIYVERELVLEDETWPLPILGYMDVEEEFRVIDIKTSSKKKSQDDLETNLQAGIYQLARHREGLPDRFDWHVAVKTKTPITQVLTRETRNHDRTIRLIATIEAAVLLACEHDLFPPGLPGWHCSEKFCGYWHMCEFGGKQ